MRPNEGGALTFIKASEPVGHLARGTPRSLIDTTAMAVKDANPASSETDNEKMDSLRQLPSESSPRRRASGDGLLKSDRHDEKASSTGTAANSSADDGKGKDAAVTVDEKKKADDAPPPVPFAQMFR